MRCMLSCVRSLTCKREPVMQSEEDRGLTVAIIEEVAGISRNDKKKYNIFYEQLHLLHREEKKQSDEKDVP